MNKLDERFVKQSSSHARFRREVGSPVNKPVPPNLKPWMLMQEDVLSAGGKHSNESDAESTHGCDSCEIESILVLGSGFDEAEFEL